MGLIHRLTELQARLVRKSEWSKMGNTVALFNISKGVKVSAIYSRVPFSQNSLDFVKIT